MIDRSLPSRRDHHAFDEKGGTLGAAVVVLLVTATCPHVFASDEESPEVGRSLSPNQSVALYEPEEPPMAPDRISMVPSRESGAEVDVEVIEANPPMFTRRIERRVTSEVATSPLSDRDTPWYRTGIGALAVVLALVGGVFWLVRRWTPALRVADGHLMRVVARTSLSPKHHAALLQLGRRLVLVAVSPGGVETLCEITDPGEVGELTGRTARAMASNPAGFDGQLNRELAEYREELHDDAGATPVSRSPRRPEYEPLTDLLHRLRALRAK